MNGTTVFFDLETGGLEPQHPTIQVAAVAMESLPSGGPWVEIDHREIKLKFDEAACSSEALELNSYDAEAWKLHAMEPRRARIELEGFFRKHQTWDLVSKAGKAYTTCRIAGHNAAAFDAPRLKALWGNSFPPFAWFYTMDTVQLALWFFASRNMPQPQNFQLGTLCEYFGINIGGAHDALHDARATARLAEFLVWELFSGPIVIPEFKDV